MSVQAVRKLMLVGGTSEIGLAIARLLATEAPTKPSIFLLGRDESRMSQAADDLRQLGSEVQSARVEATELDGHERAISEAFASAGGFDLVVIAIGLLGAQSGTGAAPAEANAVMNVNFLGTGSLLLHCVRELERQGHGTLVVLSSIAAERARASNPVYGAAKAGLDALAQGLGDATRSSGVRVLVVRPGFVRTRMTAGLQAAPFATSADAVAQATVKALDGTAHTVWVPARLRLVFMVLRHLPRALFRRLPV